MKRPIAITVIGWLFIVVGIVATGYHLVHTNWSDPLADGNGWVLLLRVLAGVGGLLVLRGVKAGRWLLVVWMIYHVALSYFHPLAELLMHTALLFLLVYFLMFNKQSEKYFKKS
jgi:hypothetical protein